MATRDLWFLKTGVVVRLSYEGRTDRISMLEHQALTAIHLHSTRGRVGQASHRPSGWSLLRSDGLETRVPRVRTTVSAGLAVLVVDDNPVVRSNAVHLFQDLGFRVFDAYSGDDGLRLIRAHPEIGLLFVDVRMPGMSGPELATAAQRLRPTIKVVFTSGYVDGRAAERCAVRSKAVAIRPDRGRYHERRAPATTSGSIDGEPAENVAAT